MEKKIKIRLIRGMAGKRNKILDNLRSLGFKKSYQTIEVVDDAVHRGMMNKVSHLIVIEEK